MLVNVNDDSSLRRCADALQDPDWSSDVTDLILSIFTRAPGLRAIPAEIQAAFSSFISNGTCLKKIRILAYERCDPAWYQFLRKCILAAKFNDRVCVCVHSNISSDTVLTKLSELLWIGAPRITELYLHHVGAAIDCNEMKLFLSTVSSLHHSLWIYDAPDDFIAQLMASLVNHKQSSLKELFLFGCKGSRGSDEVVETRLPGVVEFLTSPCSRHLTMLGLGFDTCTVLTAERLANGVLLNSSIQKMSLNVDQISKDATDRLAKFIRQAPSNLRRLSLSFPTQASYSQESILLALCDNYSIRELSFGGGFFNSACRVTLSDLLTRNRHLESLDILCLPLGTGHEDLNSCIENIGKGLATNSTLKKLVLRSMQDGEIDLRPVFESLGTSGLETLAVQCQRLKMVSMDSIDTALNNPACGLKMLCLGRGLRDDALLRLLAIVRAAPNLIAIKVRTKASNSTLRRVGPFLATTTLPDIEIEINGRIGDDDWEEEVTDTQNELIQAVRSNMNFKTLEFQLPCLDEYSQKRFQDKIEEYTKRNAIVRAARAMSDCRLAHSALPTVLKAVDRLEGSDEDYTWLGSTVLFSGLRRWLQNHEDSHELKTAITGSAAKQPS